MFHPGVTGFCGSRTQKHTLSATPMVRPSLTFIYCTAYTDINMIDQQGDISICSCVCLSGCTDDIVTSDHSPVFGTFEVGVTSQFVSKKGTSEFI